MNKQIEPISRRSFVKSVAAASVIIPMNGFSAHLENKELPDNTKKGKICAFSKLFQFLDFDQLSTVFAAAGLDGIDLTVRPDGHIEPERVKTDLPKAVIAARKNGIEVPMITTSITDADNILNQEVLKTAADNGVVYYRTGPLYYDYSKPILENLENTRKIFDKLAVFNEKTGIHGAYQNHYSQPRIGNPVWDLWYILKEINPIWMSCQYDIWHAAVVGYTSWETGLRLLSTYIKTRCIKDFNWISHNGKMIPEPVPLGDGQINFDTYFKLVKELKLNGDITLGIEYPVLSGEEVNLPMKAKTDKALAVLKRDADKLKSMMAKNLAI
ncbi:MAG: TIM barrel protein [Bacteroidota bacterium]